MSEGSEEHLSQNGGLSRSRADFIDSFERRLNGLRSALEELGREPDSAARRDHLLRRVHALGAAAKVLGFAAAAEQLNGLEELLQELPSGITVASQLEHATRLMNLLPALVVRSRREPGEAADVLSVAPPRPAELLAALAADADALGPLAVLVFGSDALEATLLAAAASTELEIERCDDPDVAFERIVAFGPDVVVVEGEYARATEFLGDFWKRSEGAQSPLVMVRSPQSESLARTLRANGVPVSIVEGPVRGHELWLAVQQSVRAAALSGSSQELPSDFTLADLTEHLALAVRRALLGAAVPADTEVSLHIEHPSEIVAPLWGALARIRETVTTLSKGSVDFAPLGPEGAVVVAPRPGESRNLGVRGRGDGVALEGRSALVVDDDPAVAGFISGLLRAAGAQAVEAHDGQRGLDLALSLWPDIIISDVFMPKMDGLALCREVKRDVAVSDTPVILLSWKEDLLLRLRELRADADGYVRKEAGASSILRTVRELLAPRARVEARLSSRGEVRGRLDRLTPRLILELVSERRPDACLMLRDPAFLYEVQIRDGRLRSATRTAADGSFDRGPSVLAALLGVTAGRFVVTTETGRYHDGFTGTLQEVLTEPIRRARAALRATTASMLGTLKRVSVDASVMQPYLGVMPPQAAQLLRQLIEGASPRALLLSGNVPPHVLEHVLSDAARKGALVTAEGRGGQDVLAEALAQLPEVITRTKLEPLARGKRAEPVGSGARPPLASLASWTPDIRTANSVEVGSAQLSPAETASDQRDVDVVRLEPGDRARLVSLPLLRLDQARRADAQAELTPPVSLQPPATGEIDEAWGSEPPGKLAPVAAEGTPLAKAASGERPDEREARTKTEDSISKPREEKPTSTENENKPDASKSATSASHSKPEQSVPADEPTTSVVTVPQLKNDVDSERGSSTRVELTAARTGSTSSAPVGVDLADAVLLAMVEAGTGTPPPVVIEPRPASAAPSDEQPDVVQGALGAIVLDPDTSGEAPSNRGPEAEKLRSLRRPVAPSLDSVRATGAPRWSGQFGQKAPTDHASEPDVAVALKPLTEAGEGSAVPDRAVTAVSPVVSPPRPAPAPGSPREPAEHTTEQAASPPEAPEAAEAAAPSERTDEVMNTQPAEPSRKEQHDRKEQHEKEASADTDQGKTQVAAEGEAKAPDAHAADDAPGADVKQKPRSPRSALPKHSEGTTSTARAPESTRADGGWGLVKLAGMAIIAGGISYGVVTGVTHLVGLRGADDARPAPSDSAQTDDQDGPGALPKAEAPAAPAVKVQTLPLPPGVTVAMGQGLLEVQTGARHAIYVDGEFVGRGPTRSIPVPAGRHEVRLSLGSSEQRVPVQVAAGVRVLLPLASTSN